MKVHRAAESFFLFGSSFCLRRLTLLNQTRKLKTANVLTDFDTDDLKHYNSTHG